jgi:hypothetical protein
MLTYVLINFELIDPRTGAETQGVGRAPTLANFFFPAPPLIILIFFI